MSVREYATLGDGEQIEYDWVIEELAAQLRDLQDEVAELRSRHVDRTPHLCEPRWPGDVWYYGSPYEVAA